MQTPTFNPAAWQNRWDALQKTMDHTLKAMQQQEKAVRQPTLESTLIALKAFGESQVRFFLDGFGTNAAVFLEPSITYPPEYALRTTLDQIAHDMDVIVRAWQQRLAALASPAMIKTLKRADTLAYQSLEPAIRHGVIENATVVTYFQKATDVRLIPYAPVIFIGLPLSILTAPQDLLAIPHEVGHYIYRFGRVRAGGKFAGSRFDAALVHRFADKPAWCVAWLEEIFADVYGALIGGPVMALGFEALVTDDPLDAFTHDDGEHPVAALRPNIYHAVFKALGGFEHARATLVARWEDWQGERGKPSNFTTSYGDTIDLADAQAVIEAVVISLLQNDLTHVLADPLWSNEFLDSESVAALDDQFLRYVEMLPTNGVAVPDIEMAEDSTGQWMRLRGVGTKSVERRVGDTGLWIDAIKAAAQRKPGFNMPPQVWMALLDGSGWATEGPGGGNAH